MEKWQKDLIDMIEAVAGEVEHFFLDMGEVVDAFFELTEEITEQMQNTIVTEVDQYLHEWAEPILEAYWEMEEAMTEVDSGFPYAEEATAAKNPACVGCRNYHGQVYGGNLLVCGMHPHGWEDVSCPDWEKE